MGIIDWGGFVKIFNVDYDAIQICKVIEGTECLVCRKRINKGSVCLGKGYLKTCLDCSYKLFTNIRNEFGKFLNLVDETEQDLIKNKEQYEVNNLASSI